MLSSPAEFTASVTLVPTRTVIVAAVAAAAPNTSTGLNVKLASPLKLASGSNTRLPMSPCAIVSFAVTAVPESFSVPCPLSGRLATCTSFSRSLSASAKRKSAAANV